MTKFKVGDLVWWPGRDAAGFEPTVYWEIIRISTSRSEVRAYMIFDDRPMSATRVMENSNLKKASHYRNGLQRAIRKAREYV